MFLMRHDNQSERSPQTHYLSLQLEPREIDDLIIQRFFDLPHSLGALSRKSKLAKLMSNASCCVRALFT